MRSRPVALIVLAGLLAAPAPPQQSRAQERTIAELPQSLYFVVPPRDGGKKSGLVVVLPGGPGTRDFLPWVDGTLFAHAHRGFVVFDFHAAKKTPGGALVVNVVETGRGEKPVYSLALDLEREEKLPERVPSRLPSP